MNKTKQRLCWNIYYLSMLTLINFIELILKITHFYKKLYKKRLRWNMNYVFEEDFEKTLKTFISQSFQSLF